MAQTARRDNSTIVPTGLGAMCDPPGQIVHTFGMAAGVCSVDPAQ